MKSIGIGLSILAIIFTITGLVATFPVLLWGVGALVILVASYLIGEIVRMTIEDWRQ